MIAGNPLAVFVKIELEVGSRVDFVGAVKGVVSVVRYNAEAGLAEFNVREVRPYQKVLRAGIIVGNVVGRGAVKLDPGVFLDVALRDCKSLGSALALAVGYLELDFALNSGSPVVSVAVIVLERILGYIAVVDDVNAFFEPYKGVEVGEHHGFACGGSAYRKCRYQQCGGKEYSDKFFHCLKILPKFVFNAVTQVYMHNDIKSMAFVLFVKILFVNGY